MSGTTAEYLHWTSRGSTGLLCLAAIAITLLVPTSDATAQKKRAVRSQKKTTQTSAPTMTELARLREEFIRLTKEAKTSLEKLQALYEKDVKRAEERLAQSRELFNQGLISKVQLSESETALALANDKVTETKRQLSTADTQIANTLLEAQAEAQMARLRVRKGALISTTAYIRFNGASNWALPDAWKIQRFFQDTFKKPLPVAVFGQGAIHDRWRLDHHNAMDVSLHPDGVEGQALINFLRNNGIPFLAFRSAIPGTATGPHIHIGRPSHRF
jgi:hypothetical protein